jgi:hypothetical protein
MSLRKPPEWLELDSGAHIHYLGCSTFPGLLHVMLLSSLCFEQSSYLMTGIILADRIMQDNAYALATVHQVNFPI